MPVPIHRDVGGAERRVVIQSPSGTGMESRATGLSPGSATGPVGPGSEVTGRRVAAS